LSGSIFTGGVVGFFLKQLKCVRVFLNICLKGKNGGGGAKSCKFEGKISITLTPERINYAHSTP